MADYTPVFGRPKTMTLTASGTIVGGQVVKISAADTVAAADTNCTNYAGVAAHDAASGSPVTVYMGAGVVHETLSATTVSAGALVFAGSATAGSLGTANSGYNVAIGVALRTTTTTTAVLRWKSLIG